MTTNHFIKHIKSIPEALTQVIEEIKVRSLINGVLNESENIRQVFLVGCGDSYHAALGSNFFFQQITGITCHSLTAMAFARYQVSHLLDNPEKSLVVGISSSGRVSRTIEAIDLANKMGARTLAITSHANSPLVEVAANILPVELPATISHDEEVIMPGGLSYFASILAIDFLALRLGERTGRLSDQKRTNLLRILADLQKPIGQTIELYDQAISNAAQEWHGQHQFTFCGAGPGYGSALFSAAKMVEASGVAAQGQDLEEWAHIDYFVQLSTPTIIISSGERDRDRVAEIITAAKAIGRDVTLVSPPVPELDAERLGIRHFKIAEPATEGLSNLLTSIPGMLLAGYHSEIIGENYFRGFSGGRSRDGGGGISRIQDSHRLRSIRH